MPADVVGDALVLEDSTTSNSKAIKASADCMLQGFNTYQYGGTTAKGEKCSSRDATWPNQGGEPYSNGTQGALATASGRNVHGKSGGLPHMCACLCMYAVIAC
jgi:hypothetical protein